MSYVMAKGFQQIEGIKYTENVNPMIKLTIILIVLQLALAQYWSVR